MPQYIADGIPTLTQRAEADIPVLDIPAAPATGAFPEAVLRAALQADLEQAIQRATDEAAAMLRERLEAELPAILARAMSRIRPG
ncbi:hypothetical protein [Bordetella sp. FB-8]|uniref:hypothetical protein n=1 Tax=Bordetella sp. FB-8 TaxID=1159870 RepID=UPI00036FC236|nr:hypothetical protein [Bordetella sp. FB-8]